MSSEERPGETVADVVREVELAWQKLQEAVESIPAERADETGVCGVWSAKIVVGHVSYWNAFEAVRLRMEGRSGDVDWQSLNDANAAETAGRSLAEVATELKRNHDLVMTAIAETPTLNPKDVRELVFDHYVEHTAEIETWMRSL